MLKKIRSNNVTGIPECSYTNQTPAFLSELQVLIGRLKSEPETCGCPFDCKHLTYKHAVSYYHHTSIDNMVSYMPGVAKRFLFTGQILNKKALWVAVQIYFNICFVDFNIFCLYIVNFVFLTKNGV